MSCFLLAYYAAVAIVIQTTSFPHIAAVRPRPHDAFVVAEEDDNPTLTKIRLSSFSPSSKHENTSSADASLVIRLLWLTDTSPYAENLFDFYQCAGAVNVALRRLAAENVLNTSVIDLEIAHAGVAGRNCEKGPAGDLKVVQRVYYANQYKFDAIIGPPCGEGSVGVGLFAESLRKPHILWVGSHPEFDNKLRYPHVIHNEISSGVAVECMTETLRQLGGWTRVAYLYESDDFICVNVAQSLRRWVEQGFANFTVAYWATLSGTNSTDAQIRSVVLDAGKAARIILTCSATTPDFNSPFVKSHPYDSFSLRVMSQAFLLGMHSGEYQWIAQRIMLTDHQFPPYAPVRVTEADLSNERYSLQPAIDSLKLPVTEAQLYEIYRSVLEFDQNWGSTESSFSKDVMSAAFLPPWNVNRTEFNMRVEAGVLNNRAGRFANYLADGIYLYGRGVQKAIEMDLDYGDSAVMYNVFRNVSFDGYSGSYALNREGKRLSDLLLYAPVATYYQNHPLKRFERRGVMRCASLSAAERAAGLTGKLDLASPLIWYSTLNGQPPPDIPICGWVNEKCYMLSTTGVVLICLAVGIFILASSVALYRCYARRRQRLERVLKTDWNLQPTDLTWPKSNQSGSRRTVRSSNSALSIDKNDGCANDANNSRSTLSASNDQQPKVSIGPPDNLGSGTALFRGSIKVFVKPVHILAGSNVDVDLKPLKQATITIEHLPIGCLRELRAMKDADHDNVNRFVGILVHSAVRPETLDEEEEEAPTMLTVTAHCAKGTLAGVLYGSDDDIAPPLDNMFKFWIINDVASGLNYLHNVNPLRWHGRLSSTTVVLDGRWTAKLTDFGLWSFGRGSSFNSWLLGLRSIGASGVAQLSEKLLWVAPEVLRNPELVVDLTVQWTKDQHVSAVKTRQAADVYSLGIVMAEVFTQCFPYKNHAGDFIDNLSVYEILHMLMKPQLVDKKHGLKVPLRPRVSFAFGDASESVVDEDTKKQLETARAGFKLMNDCRQEEPSARPTMGQVVRRLNKMNSSGSKSFLDRIISKLETYAQNLESVVQERTRELMDEKQRADTLLSRMLPASVAERLKSGEPVVPELFEEATVFFSDIVEFTNISSASTPMQVVQLLNDLYTFMDSTLDRFAPYVYKVETIGDAYMIVSGIPLRTTLHARILASVALAFLADIEVSVHVPKLAKADPSVPTHVRLRVGLNSGPCVAGVVGLQMPRYCLFGDTVNVASRMESNGEAMRIHVSHSTWQALQPWPEFTFEDRGVLHIKGKGEMRTYWLLDGSQEFT